jgi:hypothetical protein
MQLFAIHIIINVLYVIIIFLTTLFQGIYENQALLQHWQSNVRILFWNPDEYFTRSVTSPALTFQQFRTKHLDHPTGEQTSFLLEFKY